MNAPKTKPVISVRPRFDQGAVMLESIPVTAAGVVLATIGLGTLFFILLSLIGLMAFISTGFLYGTFFFGSMAALPPLFFEIKKKAYRRTAYNFYSEYFEFQYFQFYLIRRHGRVRYRDIVNISRHASMLQARYRMTTVYIEVPNLMLGRKEGFSGLVMRDIDLADRKIDEIVDLVEGRGVAPEEMPKPPMTEAAVAP